MESLPQQVRNDRLPCKICAFAAFFVFAVPAFSITVGRIAHGALVEFATLAWERGIQDGLVSTLLSVHGVFAWIFAAIALALSGWTFSLARRNSDSGTLSGGGRIVIALSLSAMLSAIYLGALVIVAMRLVLPFVLR